MYVAVIAGVGRMLAGAPPVMPASLARLAKVGIHLLGYLAPTLGVFRPFCPCLGAFRLAGTSLVRPSKTPYRTYTRLYEFASLIYFKYTAISFRTIKKQLLKIGACAFFVSMVQ